jgi:hypothetical protein
MASKGGAAGAAGKAGAKKAGQQAGGGAGKSPTKPEPPINMPPCGHKRLSAQDKVATQQKSN